MKQIVLVCSGMVLIIVSIIYMTYASEQGILETCYAKKCTSGSPVLIANECLCLERAQ